MERRHQVNVRWEHNYSRDRRPRRARAGRAGRVASMMQMIASKSMIPIAAFDTTVSPRYRLVAGPVRGRSVCSRLQSGWTARPESRV